jgi:hypothetical protein
VRQPGGFQVLLNSCLLCYDVLSAFEERPAVHTPTIKMSNGLVLSVGNLRRIGQRAADSIKHEDADISETAMRT